MAAQTIVCGTCATAVPYGRLSCPSCGELLASVAHRGATATAEPPAMPDVLYETDAAPSAAVVDGQLAHEPAVRDPRAELEWPTAERLPSPGALQPFGSVDAGGGHLIDDGLAGLADEVLDDVDDGPASTTGTTWALSGTAMSSTPTPAYMPRPGAGPTATPVPAFAGPGAYVPPMPAAIVPAGPPGPARSWAGYPPDAVVPPDSEAPATGHPGTDTTAADRRARFAEFVGWLSVAGAAFSAVGFLLPWGMVMIGSSGVSYFDRWGLAGPAHLFVVFGLLALLVLSLVNNPVPGWIRTGLVGLGLGALLFGLVWPYLLGPLGSGPGVLIVAVGSVALAVSGILALIADRHVEVDLGV